ncbi:MAG: hypothetical protein HY717_16605 [Planctomycetes bacterium]|nr:hypothetical protein [Planctomycetota bacterium]
MPPARAPFHRSPLLLILCSAVLLAGCHVDLTRLRSGNPLDVKAFESLEEGKTALGEALERLGAPDKVEWKNGKDYVWYLHEDFMRAGIRFQFPIAIFGYRHEFAEVEGTSDDTNSIALVFNENGLLQQKSLRLSEAYIRLAEDEEEGWAFYLIPQYWYSPYLLGDAGEVDFRDLFKPGHAGGLDLGFMPAPFFMILVGGNYQQYPGDRFTSRGRRVEVEDLKLWQVELGGRLQVPPDFFTKFWNLEEVKMLLYSANVRRHQGPFVYIKWMISGTQNYDVGAKFGGQRAGTYFDKDFRMSDALGAGFEYRIGHFGVHVEALYQNIDAFNEGGADLDTDAGNFQSILFGGGMSFSF